MLTNTELVYLRTRTAYHVLCDKGSKNIRINMILQETRPYYHQTKIVHHYAQSCKNYKSKQRAQTYHIRC
jgi:hypothetical protein